jgi:hypothetical protein
MLIKVQMIDKLAPIEVEILFVFFSKNKKIETKSGKMVDK